MRSGASTGHGMGIYNFIAFTSSLSLLRKHTQKNYHIQIDSRYLRCDYTPSSTSMKQPNQRIPYGIGADIHFIIIKSFLPNCPQKNMVFVCWRWSGPARGSAVAVAVAVAHTTNDQIQNLIAYIVVTEWNHMGITSIFKTESKCTFHMSRVCNLRKRCRSLWVGSGEKRRPTLNCGSLSLSLSLLVSLTVWGKILVQQWNCMRARVYVCFRIKIILVIQNRSVIETNRNKLFYNFWVEKRFASQTVSSCGGSVKRAANLNKRSKRTWEKCA